MIKKLDQKLYYDKYGKYEMDMQSYMNTYFQLLNDNDFFKKVNKILKDNCLYINTSVTDAILGANKNRKITTLLSFMLCSLDIKTLTLLFGDGIGTKEYGEGYNKQYNGYCFFFEIYKTKAMYFLDNRGTSFELEKVSLNEFKKFILVLIEKIVTDTEVVKEIKENVPSLFKEK